MFRSIFLKTLYDKRWFLLGWSAGTVAMTGVAAAFYPIMADSVGDLFKAAPAGLESIIGSVADYSTYEGYTGAATFGIRAVIIFAAMAIILGLSIGVSEENNRRLYQLLAQPVSRASVILQKWLAGLVVLTGVLASVFIGLAVITMLVGEDVPYDVLAAMSGMSLLYTAMVFSLTFGLGMAFGRRGPVIFVVAVWLVMSLLIDSFAAQVDWVADVSWLSALDYYDTAEVADKAIDWVDIAVLSGISITSVVVALVAFSRRDIREAE